MLLDKIKNNKHIIKETIKIMMIIAGVIIYAIGLKWFIYNSDILPGGFTGASVLLQRLVNNTFGMIIPLTIFNVAFNIIPAIISYKVLGKKFTLMSFTILFTFTFLADLIPDKVITTSPLLSALFGGIICGYGASLWFKAGVSGGGTDFIALSISEKYHIQTFNYVMIFNMVLIFIQGIIYGFEPALYSIIYQFISTQAINLNYRHYQTRTIFIITDKPTLVSKMLINKTNHSSTIFNGIGSYTKNEKYMLYTVATEPEVHKIVHIVKEYDNHAFINIMNSNEIQGNFNYLPVSIDTIDEDL